MHDNENSTQPARFTAIIASDGALVNPAQVADDLEAAVERFDADPVAGIDFAEACPPQVMACLVDGGFAGTLAKQIAAVTAKIIRTRYPTVTSESVDSVESNIHRICGGWPPHATRTGIGLAQDMVRATLADDAATVSSTRRHIKQIDDKLAQLGTLQAVMGICCTLIVIGKDK